VPGSTKYALVKEVEEEIGVTPCAFEEIAVVAEPRPAEHGDGRYHVFVVTAWSGGEPRLRGLGEALAMPLADPGYGALFVAAMGHGHRHDDPDI
jgi:hypothetical protein